jgi:putative transposase
MISKNKKLNRETQNRWSLNSLIQKLRYKSILNSKLFYEINESYTSKTCSCCGFIQEMPLHRRQYHCPICGLKLDRDENSAINIWKRSLAVLQPALIN